MKCQIEYYLWLSKIADCKSLIIGFWEAVLIKIIGKLAIIKHQIMRSGKSLLLDNFNEYFINEDDEIEPLIYLPYFNKINIFIGTNNSGKSKFMRKLMELKNFKILNEFKLDSFNRFIKTKHPGLTSIKRSLNTQAEIKDFYNVGRISNREFQEYSEIFSDIKNPKFYYIPTLRTAHTLYQEIKSAENRHNSSSEYVKIEDDIFLDTLRKNYSLDRDIEVFTGVHLYKDILNTRNSKRATRKKFENFETFISNNFFDGKTIDIISEFDKDESRNGNNTKEIISIHIEGENESRDLFHLGDGIQALIMLTYKIFMAEDDSYIFIDEPEINLHPGMQRLFLDQILTNEDLKEKNITYFISTHSNHFLDLTLEKDNVSIYSFTSELEEDGNKKLIIKNVNAGDNDVLKSIGVNNSSVFMANCSIWVEGISDRIYIRAFLKSYCKHLDLNYPKEDIDFAFFEYAGTNISHYFFDDINEEEQNEFIRNINAMALSNRIFLLADSDNTLATSKKGKKLKKLEDARSNNFYPKIIRSHREIENFLPNEVWEKLIIDFCNRTVLSAEPERVLERLDSALGLVQSKDFSKQYIGEFLNKVREKAGKISSKFIINESEYKSLENDKFGTLTNKKMVSEAFSKKEFSWEILKKSKVIETLTIDIYNFINNK